MGSSIHAANANVRAPVYTWNGSSWVVLRATDWDVQIDADVRALAVFDEGSGPRLFAAGNGLSSTVLQHPLQYVLRWDGSAWTWLGSGLTGNAYDLAVYDDGSGSKL